jgi:hypothetical protein
VSAAFQGGAWAALLASALLADGAAAQTSNDWRNVNTGGPLKPGFYGRIVIKGPAAPPPVANEALVPAGVQPVYLYVPPGQVRKWKQNCAKWQACDKPVLFVRVDDSPSRWGQWRQKREQVALQEQD